MLIRVVIRKSKRIFWNNKRAEFRPFIICYCKVSFILAKKPSPFFLCRLFVSVF